MRRRRIVGGVIGVAVHRGGRAADHRRDRRGGGGGKKKEASSSTATSAQDNAYEVWLYNSNSDTVSLGAQFTDAQGNLQGRGDVPGNWKHFKTVVLSSETRGHQPQGAVEHRPAGARSPPCRPASQKSNSSNAAIVSEGMLKAAAGAQGTGVALDRASRAVSTSSCCRPPSSTGASGATGP